jgi:hypothetical protein
VTPEEREQMYVLFQRIAEEKDTKKFTALMDQLIKLLERKGQRLENGNPAAKSKPS